jgi:hypothetical protein
MTPHGATLILDWHLHLSLLLLFSLLKLSREAVSSALVVNAVKNAANSRMKKVNLLLMRYI